MSIQESKKLVHDNALLKRTLHQREQKIVSMKAKVDKLNKAKKALVQQLERSQTKNRELKSAFAEEKKKLFENSEPHTDE